MSELNEQTINYIRPEVLEMLTPEEMESLEEFNSMGIDVRHYSNPSLENVDSDDVDDEEEEEEEIIEDTLVKFATSDNTNTNVTSSNVLNDTSQDFSDMFNNF